MARMITLRLSDTAYEAVKRYADADQQSMNSWIENLLDIEDMRRLCAAHDQCGRACERSCDDAGIGDTMTR